MSLFVWTEEHELGCSEIDEQHKQVFQIADDLHMAVLEDRGKEALTGLLYRLVTYLRRHFSTAERIMRETSYPGYVQHHIEHQKLTQQIQELHAKIAAGRATVTMDTILVLSDLLKRHVQADRKLGAHIKRSVLAKA
jgi:hemerythrin